MKTSHKRHKYTAEQLSEILYHRMFRRWYSGDDKIFNSGFIAHTGFKGNGKELILELLRKGADVRTGYTCTRIKGYHIYYIFEGGFND